MKNKTLTTSFLFLALVGMMFASCKKEYEKPPIQDLPIGTVYTIDSILKMESGTVFAEDASVYGIVTADEQSGNLYKAAFMQDRATGAAIELYLNAVSGVRIGDSIRVYLKGVTFAFYNNLPQLSGFEPDGHIVILANNKPITPALTTIADINAGKHLAGLVRLENVKFTDQNTFADPSTYGNRTLIDPSNPASSVIVRTSNYANFANDSLPQGTGNLIAIASVYNSTWQMIIRTARELEFEGYNPGGNDIGLPYYQDFSSSFGTYTTYNVVGPQEWEIDYSTAKMTGYVNGVNNVNEDWLISAPVALTDVDHVKVGVNYVAQYQNSNTEDVTLQISKNYEVGTDPLTADWTQMNITFPNTSGWSDFQTLETSLDEFLGETVTVAIKFLSSETQSRTMEVKYILVEEGEVGGGGGGGGGQGGDLQTMPYMQSFASDFGTYMTYDVLGAQSWGIDRNTAKMTGYSGASYANEDWLISSPVAVTGVDEAKVSVVYVAQYQSSNSKDVTLQVSKDYVYGNDPYSATWTEMSSTYPNTSGWTDFQTVETSLNDFIGNNVTVAIKYVSDNSQSRTIEIQSITVQQGHAGGGGGGGGGSGTVEGDGSRENPYTANDIILLGIESSDGNKYWVKDVIVGAINSDNNYAYEFTSSTTVKTNLIISSNEGTSSEDECVPVQLPPGDVRNGLNLAENPGNYKQEVLLYGTLEKYFQKPSVKNVSYAEINGNSFGTDPNGGGGGGNTEYFNQPMTSQSSFNVFSSYSVEGDQTWNFNSSYGAVMSGYVNGVSYANEDWLISPVIDLSQSTNPVLVFDHTRGPAGSINVGVSEGYYTVWITNEYNNGEDPNEERWEELTGVNHTTTGWAWVSSGELTIPSGYKTSTCRVAFRYMSIDGASATWEIKNVVVKEQ